MATENAFAGNRELETVIVAQYASPVDAVCSAQQPISRFPCGNAPGEFHQPAAVVLAA